MSTHAEQVEELREQLYSLRPALPEEWIFTFGYGHRAYSAHSTFRVVPEEAAGRGFRLDNRYVRIHGTHDTARERMVEIFGQIWSWQYNAAKGASVIADFNLIELVIGDD